MVKGNKIMTNNEREIMSKELNDSNINQTLVETTQRVYMEECNNTYYDDDGVEYTFGKIMDIVFEELFDWDDEDGDEKMMEIEKVLSEVWEDDEEVIPSN
jgi:hypothetical protein